MNATMETGLRFALDIALKATFLLAITLAVTALLRRSGAAARHMAATAGLLGALALPLLGLVLPRIDLPVLPSVFSSVVGKTSPATPAKQFAPAAKSDSETAAASESVEAPAWEATAPAAAARPPSAPFPWLFVVLAAWSAGALAIAARLTVGLLRVRGIRRESAPLDDPEWREETRRLARQLEVHRSVALLESARVPVAMTSGLRRPLLLLCRQARSWALERRRVVLLHELAHVRRADWLWLMMSEAALAIYWWHPLAWVLARQVRRDCERACDDLVLTAGTKPSVYAGHLLGIFRSLSAAAHPVAPAVASERPSHFEGRLRAILDPAASRRELPRGRALLSAAGLFAAAAGIAIVQPWAPVCANAAGLLPYSDPQWTAAANHEPEKTAAACEKNRTRKAAAAAPVVAVSSPRSATAVPVSAESLAVSAEAEVPEAPMPEPTGTLPAIWKTLRSVKDSAAGFVRAGNDSKRRGGGDWYSRGMDLHGDERYDEAIEAFGKAIEAGYREDAASYNIACGYALKGDRDKAFEWLKKASEAGFDLASYLERDDDLDNLKSDPRWRELKKSLREHPSAKKEREGTAAATRYERLAARATKDGEPFFSIGRELLNAERYDLSAKAFQASADRGYRVGTSLYNEACALSRGGQTRQALDLLQKALDAGFDQPDIFRKDDDLDNVRDDPRFAEIAREARDLSLPGLGLNRWIGSGSSRTKWREAERKAEEYARAHPQKGRAWFNAGYAALEGDRPEAAVDAFKKALDLGYRKPTTMYNLACSYARLDQKDPAFDWLFKALDAGFDGTGTLRGDEDLDNLRGDPRYRKALEMARAKERAEND